MAKLALIGEVLHAYGETPQEEPIVYYKKTTEITSDAQATASNGLYRKFQGSYWKRQETVAALRTDLDDLSDRVEAIIQGRDEYLLPDAPYPEAAFSSTYAPKTGNITQASTESGLSVRQNNAGTDLVYVDTGIEWKEGKKITLEATISEIGTTPAIGIAWESQGAFKGYFYRSNGQLFDVRHVVGSGSISSIRTGASDTLFLVGDRIRVEVNPSAATVTTFRNGVQHEAILFTDAPQGAVKIALRGGVLKADSIAIQEVDSSTLAEIRGSELTYYVDGDTGSDSNLGTSRSTPFKTINKALEKVGGLSATVHVSGTCRENYDDVVGLNFSKLKGYVRIIGEHRANAKVLFSSKLTLAKTAGRVNIYEAAYTAPILKPTQGDKRIFEHGRSSQPIPVSQRHTLQKGLASRLPYTELAELALVTDLDTTLSMLDGMPGRYHQSADRVYLHTSDSTDPNTNGYSYEVPRVESNNWNDLYSNARLELSNIGFFYSSHYGLKLDRFAHVTRRNCQVFGARGEGFSEPFGTLEAWDDEAAGCGNDGVNGHYNGAANWNTSDLRTGRNLAVYYNQWCHDNRGDGNSHHERGEVRSFHSLYEHNQKSGIAPASGCMWVDSGSLMRHNKGFSGRGEGVEVINAAADGRNGTLFIGYGTICEGNRIGFGTFTNAGNGMLLYNCVSRENDVAEFMADYGYIKAHNCKVTQTDTAKHKVTTNGGTITVQNDTTLT